MLSRCFLAPAVDMVPLHYRPALTQLRESSERCVGLKARELKSVQLSGGCSSLMLRLLDVHRNPLNPYNQVCMTAQLAAVVHCRHRSGSCCSLYSERLRRHHCHPFLRMPMVLPPYRVVGCRCWPMTWDAIRFAASNSSVLLIWYPSTYRRQQAESGI